MQELLDPLGRPFDLDQHSVLVVQDVAPEPEPGGDAEYVRAEAHALDRARDASPDPPQAARRTARSLG